MDDDIEGEKETGGYINLFEREEQGVRSSCLYFKKKKFIIFYKSLTKKFNEDKNKETESEKKQEKEKYEKKIGLLNYLSNSADDCK